MVKASSAEGLTGLEEGCIWPLTLSTAHILVLKNPSLRLGARGSRHVQGEAVALGKHTVG